MNKQTIAIIDDDLFVSAMTKVFLEKQGYVTVTAQDGKEGLKIIQNNSPDLIICDRAMPALSGAELLKKIRDEHPQYNDIPFIFLTSLDDRRDKMAMADLNPASYLTKPVDFEELLTTISNSLAEH